MGTLRTVTAAKNVWDREGRESLRHSTYRNVRVEDMEHDAFREGLTRFYYGEWEPRLRRMQFFPALVITGSIRYAEEGEEAA